MTAVLRAIGPLALAVALAGCGAGGGDADAASPVPPSASPAPTAVPPSACDLLTDEQIGEETGLTVAVRIDVPDRCTWEVPKPADSYHQALTVDVDGFASVDEATRLFQPYVAERVTGIGDEASIEAAEQSELAIRVGAVKITMTGLNPAVTPDVIKRLGRMAATKAAG